MENVSQHRHTLTHFVPKMPIGMPTLDAVIIKIHVFRAVIPLCIDVGEIDGEFMVCPPRIRFTRTFTRIHALSIPHMWSHTCGLGRHANKREVYIYLKTVSQLNKFVLCDISTQILFYHNRTRESEMIRIWGTRSEAKVSK